MINCSSRVVLARLRDCATVVEVPAPRYPAAAIRDISTNDYYSIEGNLSRRLIVFVMLLLYCELGLLELVMTP